MRKLMAVLAIFTIVLTGTACTRAPATITPASVQMDGSRVGPTEDGTTPAPTQRPPKIPAVQGGEVPGPQRPLKVGANIIYAPNMPGGWVVRLHQWSWFSGPPASYDLSLIQFMDWSYGGGGLRTNCINIGGNWNNAAMAVSMNAPGILNVYDKPNCYGGLVTQPTCVTSDACYQQKTCDYLTWGWRLGWWQNTGGNPVCASYQEGQPSSIRWGRYSAQ
jgi:hypothetical protein